MINTILFIMLSIIIAVMAVILYIAYLPLKFRLKKIGKLTDKTSKRINWTFVIIPAIFITLLFFYRDYRTPSKTRIERVADIQLPDGYKVLKDEYYDMFQDYGIEYQVQFNNKSIIEVVDNVKSSKFFVTDIDDMTFEKSKLPIWKQVENGYYFYAEEIKTIYTIELDTINYVMKYTESAY